MAFSASRRCSKAPTIVVRSVACICSSLITVTLLSTSQHSRWSPDLLATPALLPVFLLSFERRGSAGALLTPSPGVRVWSCRLAPRPLPPVWGSSFPDHDAFVRAIRPLLQGLATR